MSRMESILEDILYDAVENYVSGNLEEMIADICRVVSEEGKSLPSALEAVVVDWLSEGDGYFYIRDDMERQAEQSCDYEYDCEKIIFEYGFTNSLEAAKEMGVRLSATDESEVAAAVLKANLPSKKEVLSEVEEYLLGSDRLQYMLDEIREEQEAESKSEKGGDA